QNALRIRIPALGGGPALFEVVVADANVCAAVPIRATRLSPGLVDGHDEALPVEYGRLSVEGREEGRSQAAALLEQSLETPAHERASEDLGGQLEPAHQLAGPDVLAQHGQGEDPERRPTHRERDDEGGVR